MKLDAESVNKINKLAATLRNTGLAATTSEAVEKAKEIVLGKDYGPANLEEVEQDVASVDHQLEEDLKKKGIYFSDGSEEIIEEEPSDPVVKDELEKLRKLVHEPDMELFAEKVKPKEEPEEIIRHFEEPEEEPPIDHDFEDEIEKEHEEESSKAIDLDVADKPEEKLDELEENSEEESSEEEVPEGTGIHVFEDKKEVDKSEKRERDIREKMDKDDPSYDVSKEDKTVEELLSDEK